MKKNLLLIVLLMTLIPLAGYSQNETSTQFTVAGVIVDATGEPLVGTAVYVKNEPGVRSSGSGRKVQDKSNEKRYTDIPVSGYEECRDADYQKRRKA